MVKSMTHLVKDPHERKIVDDVLQDFEENVIANLHKLERGTSLFLYKFIVLAFFLRKCLYFFVLNRLVVFTNGYKVFYT